MKSPFTLKRYMIATTILSVVLTTVLFFNPDWDGMPFWGYVTLGALFGFMFTAYLWSAFEIIFSGWQYEAENRDPRWLPILVFSVGVGILRIPFLWRWKILPLAALGMCLWGIGTVLSIITRWCGEGWHKIRKRTG